MLPQYPPSRTSGNATQSAPGSSSTTIPPPTAPSSIDIEAVIQAATASSNQLSPAPRDTRTQLFVGNLPYRVRWQDLKDLFRKAGTVLRADVSLGPDNRSRGYGTVLLASSDDATKAMDMFNGFSWQTRTLEVRSDRIPPDLDLSNPLNALQFSKAQNSTGHTYPFIPPINGAFVNMDPVAAGIHMRAAAEAQQALGLPVASPIPPSTVPSIHMSPSMNATGSGRMLFVGNLPFHCQWQELKDLFRAAGQIVRADVALGGDGRSRGFGTVLFANDVDASAAVAMFNGYDYNNRTLKVHHDKFSQGNDTSHSGQSTHAPTSPRNESFQLRSPRSVGGYYGAQGSHPSSGIQSPFHPPGSPHANLLDDFPSRANGLTQGALYGHLALQQNEFAHTPGAPAFHGSQQLSYMQQLHQNLHTPPPLQTPLRVAEATSLIALEKKEAFTSSEAQVTSAGEARLSHASQTIRHAPGTITMPSQPFTPSNPLSPHMTRGIPITPSMPGFSFHAPMSTPPLPHHLLSPGLGPFSPALPYYNPYMNAAPGPPLTLQQQQQNHEHHQAMQAAFGNGVFTPLAQLPPSFHGQQMEYFTTPSLDKSQQTPLQQHPQPFNLPLQQQQSSFEQPDYFSGALALPVFASSGVSSTVPSPQTSSPLGRTDVGTSASSRGTSLPDDQQAPTFGLDSLPGANTDHAVNRHGRTKSQSPGSATGARGVPSIVQHIVQPASGLNDNRRMSWNDVSGLQRSIAKMSLDGPRDVATTVRGGSGSTSRR